MAKLSVKRSYTKGSVKLCMSLSAHGLHLDSIKADASCDLSSADARALAAALIAEADRVDAKAAKDKAQEDRREKWRQREIAAGRMVSMSPAEFLNRASR